MKIGNSTLSPLQFERTQAQPAASTGLTPIRTAGPQAANSPDAAQFRALEPEAILQNQLNDVLVLGSADSGTLSRSAGQLSTALEQLKQLTQSGPNASSLDILRRYQQENLPAAINQLTQQLEALAPQLASLPLESPERQQMVLQQQVLLQSQQLFQQAAAVLAESPLLQTSSEPGASSDINPPTVETATSQALEQLLLNVTPRQQSEFNERFSALNPNEQRTALELISQLQIRPAPANFYPQLLATRNTLTPEAQIEVGRTLNTLNLFLPNLTPTAPTSEDLSSRIERFEMPFYLGYDNQAVDVQNRYAQDLLNLSGDLGYQVNLQVEIGITIDGERMVQPENTQTELLAALGISGATAETGATGEAQLQFFESEGGNVFEWGEDDKLARQDGTLVFLPTDPQADQALQFTRDFVRTETRAGRRSVGTQGVHTANIERIDRNDVLPTPDVQGGVARQNSRSAAELAARFPNGRVSETYNEGGNTLIGTLPNGDAYAIVGYDSLLTSTRLLELRDQQSPSPVFTPEALTAQRSAMGLALPFEQLPSDTRRLIDDTAQRLNRGPVAPEQRSALRSQATDFLAKMEITKGVLAEDLGIPVERLTFISQPDFHIDMHMRPMRPGEIMINDFGANDDLLKAALEMAEPGSWEAAELGRMRERNRELGRVLQPVMREIEDQLQAAGLTVTRAPGVLESPPNPELPPDDSLRDDLQTRRNIRYTNFMNAIPMTRPGSNQLVYLTNASSIAPLQQAYAAFLQEQFGISDVYFLGGGIPEGTSPGPNQLNFAELSLRRMGGLDCREIRSLLQPFLDPAAGAVPSSPPVNLVS